MERGSGYLFDVVNFEIVGFCNAQCKYCQTGIISHDKHKKQLVDFEKFKTTIIYLQNSKLLNDQAIINLFNWGEPTLHPSYIEIIMFLRERNLKVSLSSNFSTSVSFDSNKHDLSHVERYTISLPGFSQKSYSKIHGFNFEVIKSNIITNTKNMKMCGLKAQNISMFFMVYQFNLNEYKDALDFALEHELNILPSKAYINNFNKGIEYFTGKLRYDEINEIGKDLFLNPNWHYPIAVDKNFICNQYEMLTIDIDCSVLTCCVDSTKYIKAYDIKSKDEVTQWRINTNACKQCKSSGLCYCINQDYVSDDIVFFENILGTLGEHIICKFQKMKVELKEPYLFFRKNGYNKILIYGIGALGKYLYSELKMCKCDVDVILFVDKNATIDMLDTIPVIRNLTHYEPNITDTTLEVDVIVLAIEPYYYDDVKNELIGLTNKPIIPLTALLHS